MNRCRSCGTRLVWATTEHSRPIPLEPDPDGNMLLRHGLAVVITGSVTPRAGEARYVPHFAACPAADYWRHRR